MRKIYGFICIAFCLFLAVPQSKADICGTTPGNLVANCGFETGDFTSWTLAGNDVPGQGGVLYGVEGTDPIDGIAPNSGSNQAFFADLVSNATTLSQSITTVPTDQYTVSFYLAQDTTPSAGYSNAFSASFGGDTLVSLSAMPVQGYTEYSYTVDATSASSVLSLTFGNGLGEFLVDDISVVNDTPVATTPEPPAWTLMLVGLMGSAFLWKRNEISRICNVRI
jgi:hypothetical protein